MTAARVTLLVNPFASSVTARARTLIKRRLADDFDLTVIETTKQGHAIRLAHGAAQDGADVVIALGGDGTINEVANGLLNTSTAAAPLPGGSTNVFARALGYPNNPVAATDVLAEAITARSIRPAGVGMANNRAFLFHVGAGFDAAVVERVEARGTLKRYAGHPLFVATTVDTWMRRVDRSHPWLRIETNGQTAERPGEGGGDVTVLGDAHMAVVLNCNPYTFLGDRPLSLAPEAHLGSALSVVSLRSLALHHVVGAARQAITGGEGMANGVTTGHWSGLSNVTFVGHRPFPIQMDGESCGRVDCLRIEHRPGALQVVVPPETASFG